MTTSLGLTGGRFVQWQIWPCGSSGPRFWLTAVARTRQMQMDLRVAGDISRDVSIAVCLPSVFQRLCRSDSPHICVIQRGYNH
jgi:hypothetical protein